MRPTSFGLGGRDSVVLLYLVCLAINYWRGASVAVVVGKTVEMSRAYGTYGGGIIAVAMTGCILRGTNTW